MCVFGNMITSVCVCTVVVQIFLYFLILFQVRPEVDMGKAAAVAKVKVVGKTQKATPRGSKYPPFGRYVKGKMDKWTGVGFPQRQRSKINMVLVTCLF